MIRDYEWVRSSAAWCIGWPLRIDVDRVANGCCGELGYGAVGGTSVFEFVVGIVVVASGVPGMNVYTASNSKYKCH